MFGGIVAIVGAAAAALTWTLDIMPFVKTSNFYANAAAQDMRVNVLEARVSATETSLSEIKRNGQMSLELQLQTQIDTLNSAIAAARPGDAITQTLVATLYRYTQQINEVRRELAR